MNNKSDFAKNGLKWSCLGSGACCISRDGYGYVYLTGADIVRLAAHFEVSPDWLKLEWLDYDQDAEQYCLPEKNTNKSDSIPCVFLEQSKCTVYEARPTQCRTWPFWPENMTAKSWDENVVKFCLGAAAADSPLVSQKEIRKNLEIQKEAEEWHEEK